MGEEQPDKQKPAFLISPIGETGSATREKADWLKDHVIVPALEPCGFLIERGDEIGAQWIIPQLADKIRKCHLAVVIITDLNPNVFFEMGVAAAWAKSVVALAEKGTELPFDVKDLNTVFYPTFDLPDGLNEDEINNVRQELAEQSAAENLPLSPFARGLRKIGELYSLDSIYMGKRFILDSFHADIKKVRDAVERDWQVIEDRNPEGLKGLGPVLESHAREFDQKGKLLHKIVRTGELPDQIRKACAELCEKMDKITDTTTLLASKLQHKQDLDSKDIDLTRSVLRELLDDLTVCLEDTQKKKVAKILDA